VSLDLRLIAIGTAVLAAASAGARYSKRSMDATAGVQAAGYVLVLMVANILQLLGAVIVAGGLFG
jgi:hypothetical protein